jgi:hypothetical protein
MATVDHPATSTVALVDSSSRHDPRHAGSSEVHRRIHRCVAHLRPSGRWRYRPRFPRQAPDALVAPDCVQGRGSASGTIRPCPIRGSRLRWRRLPTCGRCCGIPRLPFVVAQMVVIVLHESAHAMPKPFSPPGWCVRAGGPATAAAGSLWSWVALGRTVRSAGSMSSVGGQVGAVLGAVTPVALRPETGVPA